ncbi:MAG: hypothetical protein PVI23_00265 [Maricaulaceae bacterium]|jgi:hypothetical protein
MSQSPFASLHAGLLARKGAARPSVEPQSFPMPRAETRPEPRVRELSPRETPAGPASSGAVPATRAGRIDPGPSGWSSRAAAEPRTTPAHETTPPHSEEAPLDRDARPQSDADPQSDSQSEHEARQQRAYKTSVRLTRNQARALKLAAIILDRPQRELLATGLERQLEALACSDLHHCACFRRIARELSKS